MKFAVTIKQTLEGTLVVEATSPEAAVAKVEALNEHGWDEVVDETGFMLTDEGLRADPVSEETPLTHDPDEDEIVRRMAFDGLTEEEATAALREERERG
jgi:hypothetical protein